MIILGWIFTVVTSIVFWLAALEAAVRSLRLAGFKLFKCARTPLECVEEGCVRPILKFFVCSKGDRYGEPLQTQVSVPKGIFLFAIGLRVAMIFISYLMISHIHGGWQSFEFFIYRSTGWDNYPRMAEHGYSYLHNGRHIFLVFFPLYIYLIRIVAAVTHNYYIAGYIVSHVAYVFGVYYLYRLVRLEFSEKAATWAVIFISIAPLGFYFGTAMTESLMLLTSAMTLYYIRTHKWMLAGIAGALAMATRMVGAVFVVVGFVELFMHHKIFTMAKESNWGGIGKLLVTKGSWILLMLTGGAVFLFINWWVSGDMFRFAYYQRVQWGNHYTWYFGRTVLNQFRLIVNMDAASFIRWTIIPNILSFAFVIIMLVYAAIKRHSTVYIAYVMGYVIISYAMSWLISGARYITACVPLFIFLACMLENRPKLRLAVAIIFVAAMLPMRYVLMSRGAVF